MADREDASEDSTEEEAAGDRPGHTGPDPRGREAAPGRGHTLVVGAGMAAWPPRTVWPRAASVSP